MLLKKFVIDRKIINKYVLVKYNSNYMANSIIPYKKLALKPNWVKAVKEAEKFCGFSNSLWNSSCFKTDEMATYITHRLEKFGNDDPTFTTANYFLSSDKNGMLAWGLVVYLYSKATDISVQGQKDENSQRSLAEITEMIKISRLFHQGLISLSPTNKEDEDSSSRKNIISWNKVALLSGDFLLSKSFDELSKLRNQRLNEILALTGRDFAESEFIGDRDNQNKPLPSNPNGEILRNAESEWTLRNTLTDGSLLGACCKCSMILGGKSPESQKFAYEFGKHLALAWQASLDLDIFQTPYEELGNSFNLVCAPILFHMEYDNSLYDEINKGLQSVENADFKRIHEIVLTGPGVEKTKELYQKHISIVENIMGKLPGSDSKIVLEKIISSIR